MLRSEPLGIPAPDVTPDPAAADRSLDREALAATVLAYQRDIGAPDNAIAGAKALGMPGSSVVIAGQQPGLLGGPMLSIAKALTAIASAERLAVTTKRPVVPVFWAATEDHDVDEVNRLDILTAGDERRRLSLPISADGTMLSHVVPPAGSVRELMADLEANLPGADRKDDLMAALEATRAPTLGDWFVRLLSR
ncbi:MAG: bacillithiol biosynthesis BshC, partial [Planctomycetota bacterium]